MFDPRMILMLAAGTLLLLNGLIARGVQPSAEGSVAETADEAEAPKAEA